MKELKINNWREFHKTAEILEQAKLEHFVEGSKSEYLKAVIEDGTKALDNFLKEKCNKTYRQVKTLFEVSRDGKIPMKGIPAPDYKKGAPEDNKKPEYIFMPDTIHQIKVKNYIFNFYEDWIVITQLVEGRGENKGKVVDSITINIPLPLSIEFVGNLAAGINKLNELKEKKNG